MSDLSDAVEQFVREADTVYREYDRGYVDADTALRMLQPHLDELKESAKSVE